MGRFRYQFYQSDLLKVNFRQLEHPGCWMVKFNQFDYQEFQIIKFSQLDYSS